MRYLLDTHVLIWLAENSSKLPYEIKELVKHPTNVIAVSSVSLWEIAIKMKLGKLDIDVTLDELLAAVENSDFEILQIESSYLRSLSTLPFLHKDPFDRLLIATAVADGLTIITADENIQKYDINWTW